VFNGWLGIFYCVLVCLYLEDCVYAYGISIFGILWACCAFCDCVHDWHSMILCLLCILLFSDVVLLMYSENYLRVLSVGAMYFSLISVPSSLLSCGTK